MKGKQKPRKEQRKPKQAASARDTAYVPAPDFVRQATGKGWKIGSFRRMS